MSDKDKSLADDVLELSENSVNEMSNLIPKYTGLKYPIWIDHKVGDARQSKKPRLKIYPYGSSNPTNFSVTISTNPKVISGKPPKEFKLSPLKKFIKSNLQVLLDYWNNPDMDYNDAIARIKKQ